jgi:RHS repeat-associated protein
MEERFEYDDMNRLTDITLKRPSGQDLYCSATYDALGRMISWQAVTASNGIPQVTTVFSQPVFDATKVHALASATTAEGVFPSASQTVTYTGFDKVGKVKQGNDSLCYVYGYDRQRISMVEHVGNTTRTKRYVGNCEYITETTGGNTETQWLTYLSGSTGVFAVMAMEGDDAKTHYILKDNLGSWTTITDEDGLVEQNLSYDAWGNLRNPQTWTNYTQNDVFDKPMFDRGYTGHEHLTAFGLINMNGRMYDPVVSSFLSVDQYVSNPENAQGFNRYAYCMNNPLKYIDPSGWRPIGGLTGYTPNSASNFDPYMFYGHTPLEPRDLGLRELSAADPVVTWMEENSLHGGGGGGIDTKGGWYKSDNKILWDPSISSQNDLDELGISGKYLGQSFFNDKEGIYYSLLGYKVDMKNCYGFAGEVFSLIDLALCKYEQDRVTSKKDIFDVSVEEPSTTNFGVIKYVKNSKNDNLYSFTCNGFVIYLHIYDSSSGKEENSMNAAFCGLSSSNKYNSNNHFNLSKHTTLIPGFDLFFNNPKANSKCWRVMIVFPDTTLRNDFIYRYNNVFGHGNH